MSPQSSIAHYRIVSKLGEGGMGAVYRATDTKLNRDVAIKVLPPAFAEDASRMARFEREAQVLASLNHPNIAAIYGIEQGAIVMELVEGENLNGPIPIDTAIHYARQIAAGLEAAHEKGVVHRDLKPANIKATADGVVKLLDFGLAKAAEASAASGPQGRPAASPTISPTLSLTMTQAGMILGTAAYMAPEQARGKPVDKRADIWAFGVVLFEMLTGKPLFAAGDTVTDVIAAVITREPDWPALPADTPAHVRRLLERCLRKDPKLRLRDIGEARIALDEPPGPGGTPGGTPAAGPPKRAKRAWLPWMVAGLALTVAGAAAGVAWLRPKPAEPITVRFPLQYPEGATEPASGRAAPSAVPSPDGRYLAFIANSSEGKTSLWVRPMGSPSAHRLDKTEGAALPFWSPDGQFIAFFADEKLKKIPVAGGSSQTLCEAPRAAGARTPGDGGTWNADGVIVFSFGPGSPLMRVLAAGGPPTPVTRLDEPAGETWHAWPQFLPDGRHLLYFAENTDPEKSAIYIQELGSSQRTLVAKSRLRAAWSPPGYLLFPREATLFAQRLDPQTFRLTGEPVAVAEDVRSNEGNGRSAFAVSGNGVLVYQGGVFNLDGQLAWYGRDGKRLGAIGQRGQYQSVRLSPDEKRAALAVGPGFHADTWIMDLASGVLTRMTTDARSSNVIGPWSPDSERLAINWADAGGFHELTVASGKTRPLGKGISAHDWSPDGHSILGTDFSGKQLVAIPVEGDPQPRTVSNTPYRKSDFRFAPDGKSVAYTSYEPGRAQIFVASFPAFAEKRQVSIDGGGFPTWRKDGKELFFRTADGTVMSAEVRTGGRIEAGVPKPLFKFASGALWYKYSPAGDGQRFLVIESEQKDQIGQTMVVVNWTAELKQP
jgi:eukaryotic-like serine/threonine-protein kinase